MKKLLQYKYVSVFLFTIVFICSNMLPPVTGIFYNTYYQYSSGGLTFPENANGFVSVFSTTAPANTYYGTMNFILRPVTALLKTVDIRLLGILYFMILLLCFITILNTVTFKNNWQNWIFSLLSVFIFGDFAYLLNLNSPNIEPAFMISVIGLVTLLVCQLYKKATILKSVIFSLLVFFIGGLKTGYAFLAPVLMLLIFCFLFVRKDMLFKIVNIGLFIVISISSIFFFGNGVSPDQRTLDLNNAFSAAIFPYPQEENVISTIINEGPYTYYALMSYYVKNPNNLIANLKTAAHNAYEIRPRYISNYPDEFKLKEGFTLYSALKRRVIQPDLWFMIMLFLGIIAFSIFHMRKDCEKSIKGNYFAIILLCLIAFAAFCAPVIISGQASISRNLFMYNVFFDIILINIIVGGIDIAAKRRENLKQKYGIK